MAKIRDLPEEVLIFIFSFLKLRERKTVSRVSKLWNQLAFTDRPMRTVVLHVAEYFSAKERKTLLKSNRCYRNLTLEWTESSSIKFFIDVLDKFGWNLFSLKLSTYVITPPVLVRLLLKTPNVKELTIEGGFCNEDCDMVLPAFVEMRSLELTQRGFESEVSELIPNLFPNLRSLDLVCAEDAAMELIVHYAKQLKCLHVLFEYPYFQKFSNLDCFVNLERINVYWSPPSDYKQMVGSFQHMQLLQSASLTGPLNEDSFVAVCARWKHLKHLCLNVQSIKAAAFRKIASFGQLRSLKLQGNIREGDYLKDLKLPNVSLLILDGLSSTSSFYDHLANFVPNLQNLKIYDRTFENAQLRLVTRTVTSLRVLSLEYCYQVKDDGFQFLNDLKNLIELRCWSVPVSENAFLRFPTCPNLRTFSIGGSGWITNKSILDIPKSFPNLRELQVIDCFKVDEETVYTLQEQMKKCAIVKLQNPELDKETEAPWMKCW